MIEISGVTHAFRMGDQQATVLKDVSLSIGAGELVAIKGTSGSGKSTLLYIMGCLLRPDSGRVLIDGQDISRLTDEGLAFVRNRTIGFVFQQFHLLPRASIADNIMLPSGYPVERTAGGAGLDRAARGALKTKAENLAKELGLGGHLKHFPNQLSGGQQQRVAIARALMNDAKIILADEPTGNLDSRNAAQIIELLREVNRAGRTVVIVTHDAEVAAKCDRVLDMRDGQFISDTKKNTASVAVSGPRTETVSETAHRSPVSESGAGSGSGSVAGADSTTARFSRLARALAPLALENIRRTKARSALTMLGIVIGIAAVLSMVTIGSFTKRKILESYEELGVNKLDMRGYPNWQLKATDKVPLVFRWFSMERDITPMRALFPDIALLSPVLNTWSNSIDFGGHAVTSGIRILGVGHEYAAITNRRIALGHGFSPYHVESRSGVCIIGAQVAQQLFLAYGAAPLGQVIYIQGSSSAFGCKVIGVFKPQSSNSEWNKPDLQILVPYTYFQTVTENWWDEYIHEIVVQIKPGPDVERIGGGIKTYFKQKYGMSGRFDVDSDAILIAQMKRFLNIFTLMLAAIALISLVVGGIGITNMMLVSVTERYKEIGLRKAMGATSLSIRVQFLLETMILCFLAGLIGLVLGFTAYEIMIFGASRLVPKLRFEWIVEPGAMFLSVVSILAVGIASGLVPALKAERLEVIEALRSE